MALYSDSDIITQADLQAIDPLSDVLPTKEFQPVTISGDSGIIRKTVEECGAEILSRFQNYSGYLVSPSMGINHVAAVNNIFSTSISRPRFRLNQIVAAGPDPNSKLIRQWFVYSTLYELYRSNYARYSGKVTDRFERKMKLYADERDNAWDRLTATGIPIVLIPLPCPGAIREPRAGTFGTGNVSAGGSGSTDPGQTWNVVITWTGAAYQSPSIPAQNESGPSATIPVVTTPGQLVTVNITGLNAPASVPPNVGTADGLYTQVAASGWNIYVGNGTGPLYLQNAAPIPLATTSYTLPTAPVLSGWTAGVGQYPDYNFAFVPVRFRA